MKFDSHLNTNVPYVSISILSNMSKLLKSSTIHYFRVFWQVTFNEALKIYRAELTPEKSQG